MCCLESDRQGFRRWYLLYGRKYPAEKRLMGKRFGKRDKDSPAADLEQGSDFEKLGADCSALGVVEFGADKSLGSHYLEHQICEGGEVEAHLVCMKSFG